MPVHDPWGDDHDGAGGDLDVQQPVRLQRRAEQQGRGGIEPQRLQHRPAQARPAASDIRQRGRGRIGQDLGADARLFAQVARQQVERPEHRPGRGLEAGGQHGGGLIADLGVRQGLAGLRVAGGHQQFEQVLAPARALGPACGDHLVDFLQPAPAEQSAARGEPGEVALVLGDHVEGIGPPRSPGIDAHQLGDPPPRAADGQGEHRARGGVQGRFLQGAEQLHPAFLRPRLYQALGGVGEVGSQLLDMGRGEGGRQHPPLAAPFGPLGQEHALADDRPRQSACRRRLFVGGRVLDQHPADGCG